MTGEVEVVNIDEVTTVETSVDTTVVEVVDSGAAVVSEEAVTVVEMAEDVTVVIHEASVVQMGGASGGSSSGYFPGGW